MSPYDGDRLPTMPPPATSAPDDEPALPAEPAGTNSLEPPPVGTRYISLIVLAQFGVFMAFITPLGISLAIRVAQLAPGHAEYLGYITGAGAGVSVLTGPLLGSLSDRTRTRLGRRRPFLIAGTLLGVISLLVMAYAPTILLLGVGWVLAQLGWGQALGGLINSQADRLPEAQRGRVAGLTGFASLVAPVVGVVVSGGLTGHNLLLFGVPGVVGVVTIALFVCLVSEADSRALPLAAPLTVRSLAGKYVFNPRRYRDYSYNWLGRFLFYFGLTLNTTFTAFFLADRLHLPVPKVAGAVALLGGVGVLATAAGALGGGFLSDRLRRRRVFVLASGIVFGVGAVVMAVAPGLPLLFAGSLTTSVGLGLYSAVDQALALDVLPERRTEAGRYMGIMGFATTVPQSVAPLIAPVLLAIGATATGKNYTLLYLIAAVCTVLAGVVVLRIRSVR